MTFSATTIYPSNHHMQSIHIWYYQIYPTDFGKGDRDNNKRVIHYENWFQTFRWQYQGLLLQGWHYQGYIVCVAMWPALLLRWGHAWEDLGQPSPCLKKHEWQIGTRPKHLARPNGLRTRSRVSLHHRPWSHPGRYNNVDWLLNWSRDHFGLYQEQIGRVIWRLRSPKDIF